MANLLELEVEQAMLSIESLGSLKRLLSAAEVAQLLFVSVKTVYQWAELDQIPNLKLNGAVRFNPKEVAAWIEKSRKGPRMDYNEGAQIVAKVPRKGG